MYLDRLRLDDRVALVTGAAGGIGLAIAEALAEAGPG
jgi:NAD(P)-dependent dehydrogenase (short-subunit alcohol dehydrogenase family)